MATSPGYAHDIVIIGGCGHVGLPLAVAFADRGASVLIYDISERAVATVNEAILPFTERGAEDKLRRAIDSGRLRATTDPAVLSEAENAVVVIGTPPEQHVNPDPQVIPRALEETAQHLTDGQLVVLRSTVFPGVTRMVEQLFVDRGLDVDVAFCPERVAEGNAMTELHSLPQIVSGRTIRARERAAKLFGLLTDRIVELEPEEAELAKLFTNTWRYIKFAAVNQFYMMARSHGLDFERIRQGLRQDYPRAADMPSAGFAAGPCLLKDTMQLAAFNDFNFPLGHAAMMVNEGLPLYVVSQLAETHDLGAAAVGILGASFKAGSDDTRSSLAYKLKQILTVRAGRVLMSDPYVKADPDLVPLEQVLREADLLVVATPHPEYADITTDKPVADVWNILGRNGG